MVKVESLLVEEASLTVGGGDEARPLMLVKRGRVLVLTGENREAVIIE